MAGASWNFDYTASATMRRFHHCDDRIRAVLGPVGSGKSSGMMVEGAMLRALKQEPNPDGIRQTRGVMIRNTYTELITTTLKTFREWYGYTICTYRADKPLSALVKFPCSDGTSVECEVIFLAMDKPEDVGKLRSLELTWGYMNEASEIEDYAILDALNERIGRYPKQWKDPVTGKLAGGPTWSGIFLDSNAPDDEHWIYDYFEVKKPEGFTIFHQPPAVLLAEGSTPENPIWVPNKGQNPMYLPAENIEHLGKAGEGWNYYMNQIPGKSYEQVRVMLQGEYGIVAYGKPVYPKYNDQVYYMPNRKGPDGKPRDVEVLRGLPLMIGFDFGIEFAAAVFCQLSPLRQLRVVEELVVKDTSTREFGNLVKTHVQNNYPGMVVLGYGDPAGNARGRQDGISDIDILNECGIPTRPCVTNKPKQRIEAVNWFLNRWIENEPGLVIGSRCPMIRKGFAGRYHFKKISVSGRDNLLRAEPVKDKFSHPADGLQYVAASILWDESARNAANNVRTAMDAQLANQASNMPLPGVSSGGLY